MSGLTPSSPSTRYCRAQGQEADKQRKMMSLYAHRCNSRWAEAQAWEPAPVTQLVRLAAEGASGGQVTVFRDLAIKALQGGQLAVQVSQGGFGGGGRCG